MSTHVPWIDPALTLSGRNVNLLPLNPTHAAGLWAVGKDPELWRLVPIRMQSQADMDEYVRLAMEGRDRGEYLPFAIQSRSSSALIGSTRFYALNPAHRNLEIGHTWLTPSAWRTAANTECKLLLLRYAFETLGCVRVALRTDARNLRSQRAIERLGAKREGIFRKHMILLDGFVRDTVYYSLLDTEWPKTREFLTAALNRGLTP